MKFIIALAFIAFTVEATMFTRREATLQQAGVQYIDNARLSSRGDYREEKLTEAVAEVLKDKTIKISVQQCKTTMYQNGCPWELGFLKAVYKSVEPFTEGDIQRLVDSVHIAGDKAEARYILEDYYYNMKTNDWFFEQQNEVRSDYKLRLSEGLRKEITYINARQFMKVFDNSFIGKEYVFAEEYADMLKPMNVLSLEKILKYNSLKAHKMLEIFYPVAQRYLSTDDKNQLVDVFTFSSDQKKAKEIMGLK